MSAVPTVRVMRPDGKGYHIVNAPVPNELGAIEQPKPARGRKHKVD